MSEHEDNLRDLYAGFAMIGLLMKGEKPHLIPPKAFTLADEMLQTRTVPQGGIVSIKSKEKANVESKTASSD